MDNGVIQFTIPFTVHPKQADRSCIINLKGPKPYIHHYQSDEVTNNAAELAALMAPHRPSEPWNCPVRMDVDYVYRWRSSETKCNRAKGKLIKDTWPDLEQLDKQLCDVLEKAGFVTNDSRIADRRSRKWWGDKPGVYVRLEKLEAQP